jgi:hypothetical protein
MFLVAIYPDECHFLDFDRQVMAIAGSRRGMGGVIRWRCGLKAMGICNHGIGFTSWAALVQRKRAVEVLLQFQNWLV